MFCMFAFIFVDRFDPLGHGWYHFCTNLWSDVLPVFTDDYFSCSVLEGVSHLYFKILWRSSIWFTVQKHSWPGRFFFTLISFINSCVVFAVFWIIVMLENYFSAKLLETWCHLFTQYLGIKNCIYKCPLSYTFSTHSGPYQHTSTFTCPGSALCFLRNFIITWSHAARVTAQAKTEDANR